MKFRHTLFFFALAIGFARPSQAQFNARPVLGFPQVSSNAQYHSIEYSLSDAENDALKISVLISPDDGASWQDISSKATGSIGFPVLPGNHTILIPVDAINFQNGIYQIRIVADDQQAVNPDEILALVDSNALWNHLRFVEGTRHRITGDVHYNEVRDSLQQLFQNAGCRVELQNVTFGTYQGLNITGKLIGQGATDSVVVLDAHYDSVSEVPGADDNGSGVAGVMEALRILQYWNFDKSIVFAGFDLEEEGLVGSFAYNNALDTRNNKIAAVFNFEMIGYYSDKPNTQNFPQGFNLLFPDAYNKVRDDAFRGNFITLVYNNRSVAMKNAMERAIQNHVPELKFVSVLANPSNPLHADLTRSDHASFWSFNRPAMMLTDGANFRNPCYHKGCDSLGNLNKTFAYRVVKATIAAILETAKVKHSTQVFSTLSVTTSTSSLACTPQVFPTQSEDRIIIDPGHCLSTSWKVQVFSAAGKLLQERQMNQRTELSINGLQPGLYFLQLVDGTQTATIKFIRQ